jgi:fibronectin type 3 domain-containing protein
MERRTKAVFTAQISAEEVGSDGLEYYIEASDGDNTAIFPPSAPEIPLSVIVCATDDRDAPKRPKSARAKGDTLTWSSGKGDAYWYRIYRSKDLGFTPGPASLLTYVDKGTTRFKDNGEGLDGSKLKGFWYYRVTAVDKWGNESPATRAVAMNQVKPRKETPNHKL